MKRLLMLLLALTMVFALCACEGKERNPPGTPFDKLSSNPTRKEVNELFGRPSSYGDDYDYYEYSWLGYKGYLSIKYDAQRTISAYWKCQDNSASYEQIYKDVQKTLDNRFGNSVDVVLGDPVWKDEAGNKYRWNSFLISLYYN